MLKKNDLSNTYPIKFYNKNLPYYEFSNFYPSPIVMNGKTYKTSEHYFQASKFTDNALHELVRLSASPRDAFLGKKIFE